MRLRVAVFLLGLALAAAPLRAEDGPWTAERLAVAIPMRDGQTLAADVLLPAKPGRYPAVVVQTPYDRVLLRAALRGQGERGHWDREHYAYVAVDWRGFFGSRAAGHGRPGQRGQDGFDVVEWTAAQGWCDGKVGTCGPSALGRVQLDTAQERPPHLVCCVPLVAPIGQRHEDYYEGGVFKESHVQTLDALGFGVSRIVSAFPDPAAAAWTIARAAERPERIDVPMFFITGWYDHGTARELDSFRAVVEKGGPKARADSKLLVGPWTHMSIDQPAQGALSYPAAAGEARVVVELPPLSYAFGKDARLVLLVAGTNWPRFERNAHTGDPHFDPAKARPAKVEILHDAAHAARLVLPPAPTK